jgi:hypothetical protein
MSLWLDFVNFQVSNADSLKDKKMTIFVMCPQWTASVT